MGLSRAPQFVAANQGLLPIDVTARDISVVLSPYDACGGASVLALCRNPHTRLIFVQENHTALNVFPESLGIEGIVVANYWEALGVIAALRGGVDPYVCRRPLDHS